jgi:hypothetical protein
MLFYCPQKPRSKQEAAVFKKVNSSWHQKTPVLLRKEKERDIQPFEIQMLITYLKRK